MFTALLFTCGMEQELKGVFMKSEVATRKVIDSPIHSAFSMIVILLELNRSFLYHAKMHGHFVSFPRHVFSRRR